jgi:hypothetical protein
MSETTLYLKSLLIYYWDVQLSGYETWQVINIKQGEELSIAIKVIIVT